MMWRSVCAEVREGCPFPIATGTNYRTPKFGPDGFGGQNTKWVLKLLQNEGVCLWDCFPDSPGKNPFLPSALAASLCGSIPWPDVITPIQWSAPCFLWPPASIEDGLLWIISLPREFNRICPSEGLNPNHTPQISVAIKDNILEIGVWMTEAFFQPIASGSMCH